MDEKEKQAAARERRAIVARLRELSEVTDPTQPWNNKSDPARILICVAGVIEMEGPAPDEHTEIKRLKAEILEARNETATVRRAYLHERARADAACSSHEDRTPRFSRD